MPNKLDLIKKDTDRLKKVIVWLEGKLDEIDTGNHPDPSQAPKYIKEKDEAESFLRAKEREFKIEKESSMVKDFRGVNMNSGQIAKLSIGGSLKTSALDKSSLTDEKKKKIVEDIYKAEADDKKRAQKLLEEGVIVHRRMEIK